VDSQEATVDDFTLTSASLGEDRLVSVCLPPGYGSRPSYPVLYCADGQSLQGFADRLALEIERGHTPPVVLVGTHSSPDYRNREYLAGLDARRFEAHESFFTDEVFRWSHSRFALDAARTSCGVFGVSCGAAFALSVGTRRRARYGVVIAFSVAGGAERFEPSVFAETPTPRFYLSAGTRELSFRETGQAIAGVLSARGVAHRYTERPAGHDLAFWAAELPEAVRWCYSPPDVE
jgi:enterochelin esterase-like enzyme